MKLKRLIKSMNGVLAGLLSILGFVGCENEESPVVMYGVMVPDYIIKGTVVNKETKKPIEGIRVSYESRFDSYIEPSVLTDEKGEFSLTLGGSFLPVVPVYAEDIDGEENGLFQPEQLDVDFSKAEYTPKPGRVEVAVNVNVELTEIKGE